MIEAALAALRAAGATRVVITFDLGTPAPVASAPEPEPTAEPASMRAAREAAEDADPTFRSTTARVVKRPPGGLDG